ncbi:hypothetical protein B0H39_003197 [Clostridium beijerinckii]|uniref:hypothetical protein n=1 Tax=Clostridium beijerinckii TaxID=1520 RepID=UPI001494899D|nr:hypothetical protein [Clostridium beijerinckii]NOW85316.1 hypothetical protein [Clostridium beijerinckii]
MFVRNLNLRKRLGMSRLMEADAGAGSGSASDGTGEGEGEKQEDKTFTQADVDKMIKDRLAREKKGQLSKEELKAYQDWKDSQKTDSEKKEEAIKNAEKAKQAAEEKAASLEAKVTCLSKGVSPTALDDVVVLAKVMISDDVTIEQAIDKILEKYPHFKGETTTEEDQKGFKKVGSGGGKGKTTTNEAIKAAFGIKNK